MGLPRAWKALQPVLCGFRWTVRLESSRWKSGTARTDEMSKFAERTRHRKQSATSCQRAERLVKTVAQGLQRKSAQKNGRAQEVNHEEMKIGNFEQK